MVKKTVMAFAEPHVKPTILNGINWSVCEAAFGLDSDAWPGGKIELYADPNVMYDKQRVGGVRVRIPVAAPKAVAHAVPKPETPLDPHAKTLKGLRNAIEASNADAWLAWGEKQKRTLVQRREQEATHALALERIALREGPAGEPELVGAGASKDIPF